MSKLQESKEILDALKLPEQQKTVLCCFVLLSLANLTEDKEWSQATNEWLRIHDMIAFTNLNYDSTYAENSRETFRKQAIHHFRNAAIIEDNGVATNSPNYRYRLTLEMLNLIRSFKTEQWIIHLQNFQANHNNLKELYSSKRDFSKIPITINNQKFLFSLGEHNNLQKLIIEEFVPRFAQHAECLYIGDSVTRDLVNNSKALHELGLDLTVHDKLPDVILYSKEKNWLYFIEAVTSVGPMSPKRIQEIKEMTGNVKVGLIFITAFLDRKTYKKFFDKLAWDTEVWIAEEADHMIHLNGDRFIGPR